MIDLMLEFIWDEIECPLWRASVDVPSNPKVNKNRVYDFNIVVNFHLWNFLFYLLLWISLAPSRSFFAFA